MEKYSGIDGLTDMVRISEVQADMRTLDEAGIIIPAWLFGQRVDAIVNPTFIAALMAGEL